MLHQHRYSSLVSLLKENIRTGFSAANEIDIWLRKQQDLPDDIWLLSVRVRGCLARAGGIMHDVFGDYY